MLWLGGIKIEFRKLIKFGNSSHIISLPQKWLKKNNLNKGNLIYLTENGNGELILSSKFKEDVIEKKEITIEVDGKSLDEVQREITAAYINNFHTINIIGDRLSDFSEGIRVIFYHLMALEIMEQTQKRMVAKDFLNMKAISIQNIIRRMDIIIRAMLSDSKTFGNKKISENIYNRDIDVNKLTFLAYRTIKFVLDNPSIMNAKNATAIQYLNYWQLIDNLERVADESKRLSKLFGKVKTNQKIKDALIEMYSEIEKNYLQIMKAYYNNDKELAYRLAHKTKSLINSCNELFDKYHQIDLFSNIIEKMKAMVDNIRTVGRVIYD